MGITGLLPFLKNASRQANVDEFKGCTVAVDTYCWLHKGVFSCADKFAMGEKTNGHVLYVMKLVNLLLAKNLKPVMVFDGCHLPSKADVEQERKHRREQYKKKAAQCLREGKRSEARECFQRAIDITPEMASDVMKACRSVGVDCIVAPYEADAQLAYLNKIGIADLIISEDSDLIPFGCDRVLYKMDGRGNGILIEKERLNRCTQIQDNYYTFEKFRQMCILSGCDYLTKLPGVGLVKANKLFKISSNPDIRKVLRKMPTLLNLKTTVSDDFIEEFIKAENTFLYQLVFDPLKRKLVPLTPYPEGRSRNDYPYAGPHMSDERAYQIAIGNLNIYTNEMMDNFDPTGPPRTDKYADPSKLPLHLRSVWTKQYKIRSKNVREDEERSTTRNLTVSAQFSMKRARKVVDCDDAKSDGDLANIYGLEDSDANETKRRRIDTEFEHPPSDVTQDAKRTQYVETDNDDDSENHDTVDDNVDEENFVNLLAGLAEEKDESEEKVGETVAQSKSSYFSSVGPVKSEERPCLREMQPGRKNIFAIQKNEPKRERLDLNAVKPKQEETTLVKSRFFSSESPEKKQGNEDEKLAVNCGSPMVHHEIPSDVVKPSMKFKKVPFRSDNHGLNRLSAFSWAKSSSAQFGKIAKKETSFPSSGINPLEMEDVNSGKRPDSTGESKHDEDGQQLRTEILSHQDDSVLEENDRPLKIQLDEHEQTMPKRRSWLVDSTTPNSLSSLGSPRTLQNELGAILAGAKKDMEKHGPSKPRTQGCRSIGLSKRGRKPADKIRQAEQPKLTSFLSKFRNDKPVPRLRLTEPKFPSEPAMTVDLTQDPVEINYESFLGDRG